MVLAGRTMEPMESAAKGITSAGGKASARKVDVTDEKGFVELVDGAVAEFGKLDIMVNNAGYNPFDTVINGGDFKRWQETLNVNVLGFALGMREAVRVMKGKTATSSTSPASRHATLSRTTRCTRRPSTRRAFSRRAFDSRWRDSRSA